MCILWLVFDITEVDTGMYVQTWQAIGAAGVWARHNYVVKVDADAVFFATKLVEALRGMAVPAEGVYLENCPFVEYGYFGNLGVFSKNAFGALLSQMEDCYSAAMMSLCVCTLAGF